MPPDLPRVGGEGEQVRAGGVEVLGSVGELLAQRGDHPESNWACTASASAWSKIVRTWVATCGCADFGTRINKLRR